MLFRSGQTDRKKGGERREREGEEGRTRGRERKERLVSSSNAKDKKDKEVAAKAKVNAANASTGGTSNGASSYNNGNNSAKSNNNGYKGNVHSSKQKQNNQSGAPDLTDWVYIGDCGGCQMYAHKDDVKEGASPDPSYEEAKKYGYTGTKEEYEKYL